MFFIFLELKRKCKKAFLLKKFYNQSNYSQDCFMFETNRMKRIIFLLFSSLALVSSAQQNHCATEFSAAQWQQLRAIQQQIDANP